MQNKFEKFEHRLAEYSGEDTEAVRLTYQRLSAAAGYMDAAEGEERQLFARGVWLAEHFALKYFIKHGHEIETGAFKIEEEPGDASHHYGPYGQTGGHLELNPNDAVFEFLAGKYESYRNEWLYLLQTEA